VFASVSHFHRSLVLESKAGAYHSGALNSTLFLKLAYSLARNIRLEWKWLTLTNTLAYYNTARITAVKSFIVEAPGVWNLWKKLNWNSSSVTWTKLDQFLYYQGILFTAIIFCTRLQSLATYCIILSNSAEVSVHFHS
jgi:hypothetical protein